MPVKQSAIGWTDYSGNDLNFVAGCTPISAGCQNCYGRAIYERFGLDFGKVTIRPDKLERLARAKFPYPSPKRGAPHCPMAFVCDTGDLFHEAVPADFIADAFAVMSWRKDVIWQVLTKRPERFESVLYGQDGGWYLGGGDYFRNIWIGTTVENQKTANERLPHLLEMAANGWTTFVSVEPMLEPMALSPYLMCEQRAGELKEPRKGTIGGQPYRAARIRPGLDWVIAGGESGPHRRPFDAAWAVALYEQCREAGIPFFYKQGSSLRPGLDDELPGYGRVKEWPA